MSSVEESTAIFSPDDSIVDRLLKVAGSSRLWSSASSLRPVVLLYHGVPRHPLVLGDIDGVAFERHVSYLSEHFDLVPLDEVSRKRSRRNRPRILLTFDDGFRNNLHVVAPILRRYSAPATFFVCGRSCTKGRYLWFVHFRLLASRYPGDSLTFRGVTFDMRPEARASSVEQLQSQLLDLKPHPQALYDALDELPALNKFLTPDELEDWCAGMSETELAELDSDPLFTVELHTQDHPFLSRCDPATQADQIRMHRRALENTLGRRCRSFAYPIGDYNDHTLDLMSEEGFEWAFAVGSRDWTHVHTIPRLGVYARSTGALSLKALWGNHLRALSVSTG